MYSVVDLFAGAGGMSLGFRQTKLFEIKAAFENNPNMRKTYKKNHRAVDLRGDVCEADYKALTDTYGEIDVVIGGPPCQGFSNANRQKNHVINENNSLVKQYVRAIVELKPSVFLMENVSMLSSDTHRFYLDKADLTTVNEHDIKCETSKVCLLEKEYYFDEAIKIVCNRKRIKKHLWPDNHYYEVNVIYKSSKNEKKARGVLEKHRKKILTMAKEYIALEGNDVISKASKKAFKALKKYYETNGEFDVEWLKKKIEPAILYQRMLSKSLEIKEKDIVVERYSCLNNEIIVEIKSYAVIDYIRAVLGEYGAGYQMIDGVISAADYGAPQRRMRYVVIGQKVSKTIAMDFPSGRYDEKKQRTVRDAIGDIENVEPFDDIEKDVGIKLGKKPSNKGLIRSLRNSKVLKNHVITKSTDVAIERFKALEQGENFHALKEELKTNTYTDTSRTQRTIYLRLKYDEPSGTVVNVRKSMWIHPKHNRAISIREAARLQTFPDSFVFCGTKDQQYQQVGNAVPPLVAKELAKYIASILALKKK